MNPYTSFSTRNTPQNRPIPGQESRQIKNDAGGFVFDIGMWPAVERFLILGTEGGTYYVGQKDHTYRNAVQLMAAAKADGRRLVDMIVDVSVRGRSPKQDAAIFALAVAASAADISTRRYALSKLPEVCRIPTHLFHFFSFVKNQRGMGRSLKRQISEWYQDKDVRSLAFHMVKYQSRDGVSNRDLLRLTHPDPKKSSDSELRQLLYNWIVKGAQEETDYSGIPIIQAFENAKKLSGRELAAHIRETKLAREMVPTEALKDPEVWDALLETMKPEAMLRNLGNMSKVGLLKPLTDSSKRVCDAFRNQEAIRRARLHPIQILLGLKTYSQGRGMRGDGSWNVVPQVVDALDDGFYLSFGNIEPTNKRLLVAVDISGSMTTARISNYGMSAAEGAAAMAMSIIRSERDYHVVFFDTEARPNQSLTNRMTLKEATRAVSLNGGGTDCSSPFRWLLKEKLKVDGVAILTDNESWAGRSHMVQTVREYREKINPKCKVVNVGMTATRSTVLDPNDTLSLDVIGFDATVPQVVSEFLRS